MNQLFAFELAVEVPSFKVDGYYDEEQELWVGEMVSYAGGSYFSTATRTCYPMCTVTVLPGESDIWDCDKYYCQTDHTTDWDCDNSLPGPC